MNPRFLFHVAPYSAIVFFIAGLSIRYVREARRTDESAVLVWKFHDLGRWLSLLYVSLLVLFLGHLAGIVFPQEILDWNKSMFRLYALEASAFGAGLLALAGWMGFIWIGIPRLGGTVRERLGDELFLTLLLVALLTGSYVSVIYRWGSSWGVMTLTPYVRSLFRNEPMVELAAEMPFFVRLHVFSAFSMLFLFPFTRFSKLLLAVFQRGVSTVIHPVAIHFEQLRRALRLMLARHNPTDWLWPEED
jgi:nitrate reductase gamma subunit